MPDQYLVCRDHDGSVLNVAQILGSGIEVQGRIVSLEKFQELLGPKPRITFLDGRVADFSSISEAITAAAAAAAANTAGHQQQLLEDENDEFCLICSLGGDLICCETCPATFHTECIGLTEIPVDDWFCPACCCARCDASTKTVHKAPSSQPELIPCDNYTSHRLLLSKEKEIGKEVGDEVADKNSKGLSNGNDGGSNNFEKQKEESTSGGVYHKLHLEDAGAPLPLYTIKQPRQQQDNLVESGNGRDGPSRQKKVVEKEGKILLENKGKEEEQAEKAEYQRQRCFAECCALGEIPIATATAAKKPMQISFQLINTAAVYASSSSDGVDDSRTISPLQTLKNSRVLPGYSEEQRCELRRVLSAALLLIRSVYAPILDSRTGCDVLPWLFRGKTFESGCADYSTMHVAVLFVGSTISGAACVRSLGNGIAELPIFAIRPELRGNRLGELFLSQVESVLQKAKIEVVITPAMILPGWPFTPSSFLPREALENFSTIDGSSIPQPMQSCWGYTLASKEEMQIIAKVRPLAFPGVYTCIKKLYPQDEDQKTLTATATTTVANSFRPRSLPNPLSIAPEIHVELLGEMGFVELRCDQGSSPLIPVRPARGFRLVIKTAAKEEVPHVMPNYPSFTTSDHMYGDVGGGGGTGRGTRTADDGTNGPITNQQKESKVQDTISPSPTTADAGAGAQQKKPVVGKRSYTKRKKQEGEDVGGGGAASAAAAGGGGSSNQKKASKLVVIPQQPPQVLQFQQPSIPLPIKMAGVGGESQQTIIVPAASPEKDITGGRRGPGRPKGSGKGKGRGKETPLPQSNKQKLPQQQQKHAPMAIPSFPYPYPLPPGAPVLRSIANPNQVLPLLDDSSSPQPQPPTVTEQYAAIQHVQQIQAQQLAEVEDAIRKKQESLLQGMAVFREQQRQLTTAMQQHQVEQQYNTRYSTMQQQNAARAGGRGYQQPQQQEYFQQRFDNLPPLESIYENHQRNQRLLQEQQQQQEYHQNLMAVPPGLAPLPPGQMYRLSSSAPQQPQQQQQPQQFNPLMPMASQLPPQPFYYYGNGNGNGNGM